MNIFLTSPDPRSCAQALDNQRLVKMCLETAQLLSTACRMMLPYTPKTRLTGLYQCTHWNHPCGLFTRQSFSNFKWLVEHGLHLTREYEIRYDAIHKSESVIIQSLGVMQEATANGHGLTEGWDDKPLLFSFNSSGYDTGDVFEDYRHCMRQKWVLDRKPEWGVRGPPSWR